MYPEDAINPPKIIDIFFGPCTAPVATALGHEPGSGRDDQGDHIDSSGRKKGKLR